MSTVITIILDWIFQKLVSLGLATIEQYEAWKKSDQVGSSDGSEAANAKSDQDRSKAATDINNNLFG